MFGGWLSRQMKIGAECFSRKYILRTVLLIGQIRFTISCTCKHPAKKNRGLNESLWPRTKKVADTSRYRRDKDKGFKGIFIHKQGVRNPKNRTGSPNCPSMNRPGRAPPTIPEIQNAEWPWPPNFPSAWSPVDNPPAGTHGRTVS